MKDDAGSTRGETDKRSGLAAFGDEAGCVVLGVPVAAVIASVFIFSTAVQAGSPWAGSAATAALAAMALGVVWVASRRP